MIGELLMRPVLYLLFLSVLWGSSFLWTKGLLDYFEPTTIVFLRCLFGILVLLPFLLRPKNRKDLKKVTPKFLLVVSLAGAIPWKFIKFPTENSHFNFVKGIAQK